MSFFLARGGGSIELFALERDRQPREITFVEVRVLRQQRIKFNKLTACYRLLGLLWNVTGEGGKRLLNLLNLSKQRGK